MAKDSRSFFEKLTGAVRMDEELEVMPQGKAMPSRMSERAVEKEVEEDDNEGQLTVDVYQSPTEIVIKTIVAGVRPEDLDISINKETVTIRGKREGDRSIREEDYVFKELYWGSFARTVILPQEIDPEEAEAIEKHGLLIIKLPKIDKNRQTKLKVKTI